MRRSTLAAAVTLLGPAATPSAADAPALDPRPTQDHKLPRELPSAAFPFESRDTRVLDSHMHWVESGAGDVVLFLHGNPTSSYLWRNVLPWVAKSHRAIAIDLIGMGASGKPDLAYDFADHLRYLEAFIAELGLERLIFVGHDWGAALAFEYARRHPARVSGLAFMEGVLPPTFPLESYEAMGEEMAGTFRAFRDPQLGPKLVIEENLFVEKMLPGFVDRSLTEQEMTVYRAPYLDPAARRPLLEWPRQLPIAGEPAATARALEAIGSFMAETTMPILLVHATPGVVVPEQAVEWYRGTIQSLETVHVGPGLHFLQEDHPEAIGRAIAEWLRRRLPGED